MATLHYIYDPLCGWCYGAAPLVAAAKQQIQVVAHGGGMMAYDNRKTVTASLRNYVIPHDQRIAHLTGQPFGQEYYEGLLRDHHAVFDSEPPITAVLAAEKLAKRGLDLLSLIQKAHYVEGQRIAKPSVLSKLATKIGIERDIFEYEYQNQTGAKTRAHILESRQLLQRCGGQGFPTFILERDGTFEVISHAQYYGNLEGWRELLATLQPRTGQENELVNVCGIDGCAN